MKQLQKLYNQEVHLEELAVRDAFLQIMCTSSITLFRHCASQHRFFTAVKALLCQYLPASNAKLIQVERNSSSGKSFLVLQDNQTFEVAESESIGIAGHVAHAMLSIKDGDSVAPDLSRSSSSNGSPAASQARTSNEVTYSSAWLESHADCILPNANGQLLLLFPAHTLYRIGFHQEVDLTAKKKDVDGAQLLVMGLKSASGLPIGIVEVILPSDSLYNVEFLDAFGVLLATALESRLTICRSAVNKLEIQVVESRTELPRSDHERSGSVDATSNRCPVLSVPLLEDCGRIDLFGDAAVLSEQDEALLRALQKPLTRLCSEKRDFRQQARGFERSLVGLGHLWANLSGGAVEAKWTPVRAYFSEFMDRLIADHNSDGSEDHGISSARIRFLFRGEAKDAFKLACAADTEHIDSDLSSFSGVDGHFSILQQVMDSGEAFELGETVLVLPIRKDECQHHHGNTTDAPLPRPRAAAAMILILPVASDSGSAVFTFTRMIRLHVAPLLVQFAEHLLFKMKQADHVHELQQRLDAMSEQEASLIVQITDGLILKDITHQLLSCSSLEELVLCVNSIATSNEDVRSKFARATLFISAPKEPTTGRRKSITSVWSLAEDVGSSSCKKLKLVDERNPEEMRGCGIPSYVLFTQEPLSYTSSHHAFSPSRQDKYDWFYAVPLAGSTNKESLGVLEFAFESESQRERFLGDPLLLNAMTVVLTQFSTLHQHFTGNEERICEAMQELTDLQSQVREKWVDFVTKWSSLPLEDFDAWKREVTLLLLELLPSDDYFVNVLCSIPNQTDEENAAVHAILSDAGRPPHSSNTLNVLNQTILPRCMAFPLKRSCESSGVLVFSKKDDEPFTSEEQQLGLMASCLLSNQVVLFKRKAEYEAVVRGYEERITEQLDTIARAESSSSDLAKDLRMNQTLLQVSSIPYDKLVSSLSIEQLCERAIQTINKFGQQAPSDEATSKVCFIVFDADQQAFKLVGSGCPRLSISAGDEDSRKSEEPWFSEHRISIHKAPFTTLPPKLVGAFTPSQLDSITIAPVCGTDESGKRELVGLLVVGNKSESSLAMNEYLLGLAKCFSKGFGMKRDYDDWSAKQRYFEATVSDLQTQKRVTGVRSELFNLARELWCDLLSVLSSLGSVGEWKRRLTTRLTDSLVKILQADVELTRIELIFGKKQREIEATIQGAGLLLGGDSSFTKDMVVSGEEDVFLGRLCVAWKPQNTKLSREELLALLKWISTYLRDLLHHCFMFETIQARVNESMAQCSVLNAQASEDAEVIHRIKGEQHQWHSVQDVTRACASVVEESGGDPDVEIIDGESPWCRLFATIQAIGPMKLKLWLVDETNTALWTVLDGKKETKALVLRKDKIPSGSNGPFSMIELVYTQSVNAVDAATSRVVLGVLEVVQTDEPLSSELRRSRESELAIQQLVIVLTHTLRIVKQSNVNRKLEVSVRQLELKAAACTSEWKQHVSTCFEQMVMLQSKINKFVSAKASSKLSVNDSELWLRELLEFVETSTQSSYKGMTDDGVISSGPRLIQLRSYLLFEGADGNIKSILPPVLHSCKEDCRSCFISIVVTHVQELEAIVEENGDARGFALDIRRSAAGDDSSYGITKHPALSLLLSGCHVVAKNEGQWELDTTTTSTHQLIVKTFHRTMSEIGVVRVLLLGVAERYVEIDNTSSWQTLNFYGEMVLNAVQRLLHTALLCDQTNIVSGRLLKTEQTLTESRQAQGRIEGTLSGIGSLCQALSDLESLNASLSGQIGKVFQTVTGTAAHAHLCVRASKSDDSAEWEVIGGKNDLISAQELLQIVEHIDETATTQGKTVSSDTWIESGIKVNLRPSAATRRFLYRLCDARGAIVGALILDASMDCLVLQQNKLAGSVKAVLQVTAAAVGVLRNKLQHESRKQKLLEERNQLLLDKCQLELNSLEMKNLLHNNESHLLSLRNHCEQVVHPTNKVASAFLYELIDLETSHDVVHGLGQAITSLKDVAGVQFTVVHKTTVRNDLPKLFSSIVKDKDKRFIRSNAVYEAAQKCAKQSEMIQVCSDQRSTDIPGSCAQASRCAVIYSMTVSQDVQASTNTETMVDATAEPWPTMDLVVIVLTSAPNVKPPTFFDAVEGRNPMAYQLKQIKLLIRLATMRCQSLAQRYLWQQQLELFGEKERNAEAQLAMLNVKCDQWLDRHDLQVKLQRGLVHQMALGLPLLYAGSSKALSSKHMLGMWQALLEILCSRLEGAFLKSKMVARSSVQLYGAVQEANFFFTFGGRSTGAKRLQVISFQQCAKDSTREAIWKAFVNEATVQVSLRDSKSACRDTEAIKTVFPVMDITGDDDQGHERVAGVLVFVAELPLDEEEKDVVQEFLTWVSPALLCIGRSVYRKMTKKHTSRQVSTSCDPCFQPREMGYATRLNTSLQVMGPASVAMLPDLQTHESGDTRPRTSVEVDSVSTIESADGDAGDNGDGEDEVKATRRKKEKFLPGIVTLLLKLQETNDVRSLMKLIRHEVKRLWAFDAKKPNQGIHECQLLRSEDSEEAQQLSSRPNNADLEIPHWLSELMKAKRRTPSQSSEYQVLRGVVPTTLYYESSEQFRVVLLPDTSRVSGYFSCLLITGSTLEAVFDADDERIHLPQLARSVHRQLAQLTRLADFQEVAAQLHETKRQESFLLAKASQLENTVADMEGFLVFQSALSGVETERVLNNLVVEYLKKLLQCERVVFQVVIPDSRAGVGPSHQFEPEGDTVASATSTLEMDNILRLRVFSPNSNERELLAVCTARMGAKAELLNGHKQELLRRVSPLIGSAMHCIRVQEKMSHHIHLNDDAKSEVDRLNSENKELRRQLQQLSLSREHFDTHLNDQQALVAENKRLEAQCARMASQLDKVAREREEQQFELAACDKVNAKLTFQLDQFANVEAQIQQIDDENNALRRREKRLEKKVLKQRLQLQQIMSEVGQFKQKEDFDRHEIAQLQHQLAVLNEKQRQLTSGAAKESPLRSQSSRYLQHMQHQAQKRKQESLAQELRQLTAMEIREMKIRNREQRGASRQLHTQTQERGGLDMRPPQAKSHIA